MKGKLLLIGGGGHCASIIDSLIDTCPYETVAVVDNCRTIEPLLFSVVGSDNDLQELLHEGYTHAFISLGSVGNADVRERLYNHIQSLGYLIPNIIDKSAIVSKDAVLGDGIYVGKNAVVGARSVVGNCAIINTSAVVEHDCNVAAFAHISTSGTLCGNVKVGIATHIGASTVVREGLSIGDHSIIGIGSVVTKSFGDHIVAFGNPCKEYSSNENINNR